MFSHLQQTIEHIRKEIENENKAYLEMTSKIQDLEFELRNLKADAKIEKDKVSFELGSTTVVSIWFSY